jgi:hypothetical protein
MSLNIDSKLRIDCRYPTSRCIFVRPQRQCSSITSHLSSAQQHFRASLQQRTSTLTKFFESSVTFSLFLTWFSSPLQLLWQTQFSSRKWTHHELKRPDYIPAKRPINATRIFSGLDQFKLNSIIIFIRSEITLLVHYMSSIQGNQNRQYRPCLSEAMT